VSASQEIKSWDTDYEWKVVLLLALGFGLVGLDRWILAPLYPFIAAGLGLAEGDIGYLAGVLGIVWGLFAIFAGRLSDRIGHRKVLIPSIILFSLMSGFSGLAHSLTFLVVIRSLMGATEGAFCPTSFAATAAASKPERRGFNLGLQQSGFALFGFALAPMVATQLLTVVPSWREVFWVVAIPGFLVALLLYFVLRDPGNAPAAGLVGIEEAAPVKWMEALKSRNIIVCMMALICAMACVFVLGAMVPIYLMNVIRLSPQEMGIVTSAMGFGGFIGQFSWPGLSDKFGRKPLAIIGFLAAAVSVYWFSQIGADTTLLFVALFITSFFCLGNVALITGPIATESAPAGLVAASIGIVVGAGEIFGGGVAPAIAGFVANNFGLPSVLTVALTGVSIGVFVCLLLKETAPLRVGNRPATT